MFFLTDLLNNAMGADVMSFVRIFLLLGMFAIVGCGSGENAAPVDADTEVSGLVQDVKTALEAYGEEGAGYGEVRGVLSALEGIDPAKAASIATELDALDALTDPAEKQAKAKEIASTL